MNEKSKPNMALTFTAKAQKVKDCSFASLGIWTDGMGVYCEDSGPCWFRIELGKTYKVIIEELD